MKLLCLLIGLSAGFPFGCLVQRHYDEQEALLEYERLDRDAVAARKSCEATTQAFLDDASQRVEAARLMRADGDVFMRAGVVKKEYTAVSKTAAREVLAGSIPAPGTTMASRRGGWVSYRGAAFSGPSMEGK